MQWFIKQNNTICSFEFIQITFPNLIDLSTVIESSTAYSHRDRLRTYLYDDVIRSGGILTIRYVSASKIILLLAQTAAAVVIGGTTDIITLYWIEEEKIRARPKASLSLCVAVWFFDGIVGYFWYILEGWPINEILPIFVGCLVIGLALIRWFLVALKSLKSLKAQDS